jgi:D-alanyl-D-alanine carboxypeptidase (penicillin-binding protein 5/6)
MLISHKHADLCTPISTKSENKIMKIIKKNRIVSFITAAAILLPMLVTFMLFAQVPASAVFMPDVQPYSEAVYMMNLDTNIEAYKKNELEAMIPASTTKIMTCLLALELVKDLDAEVRITYDATNEFWEGDPNKSSPSNAALEPGQTGITYRDCLYALMVASACEAANILAYSIGGDEPTFVEMMNQRAKELGCVNTHFANAHGLYEYDNFTCAYDLYVITRYAYETQPEFKNLIAATEYTFPPNKANPTGYVKRTTNKLLSNTPDNAFYYSYATGVKTGSLSDYITSDGVTHEGVACLVSIAAKDGFTYLTVTLGAPYHDENGDFAGYSFRDHLNLYEWAFSSLSYQLVLSKSDPMGEVKVLQGENADGVQLRPAHDYATLLPIDLDKTTIQRVITRFEDEVYAPVNEGDPLGRVELKLGGESLAYIDLLAAYNVERSQAAIITGTLKDIITQTWFIAMAVIVIVLGVTLVILNSVRRARKARRRRRR